MLPHVDLVNAYGPTEATVYITHHTYERATEQQQQVQVQSSSNGRPTVSIGRPLTNSKCYVVDRKDVSRTAGGTEGGANRGSAGGASGRGLITTNFCAPVVVASSCC